MPQNQIVGTENNDILSDTPLDDEIFALSGNDEIKISSGNNFVDGGEGYDQLVANYSQQTEDLMFMLNNYGESGWLEVNSYMTGYNNRIDFNSIESFVFNSGRGNDSIELGYDNYSDDFIDAGAGDDFINAGLGNDTIDGGSGFDVLRLDFTSSQTGVYSFSLYGNRGEYSDGFNRIEFSNIEAVDVIGSNYDDVLVAIASQSVNETTYPMSSWVDGGEGYDQLVADYSTRSEDLMFNFDNYGESGWLEVNSYMSGYNSRIDFNSIESFVFNSGRGNDSIELGYDNYSDDFIDAGAGDDFINAGLGNDTIDGGAGFDVLRLDFTSSQTGVYSFSLYGNRGEYSDGFNRIEFSNIEAVDVIGSNYDDVLVAIASQSVNDPVYPVGSMINGGEGYDQLVADYSTRSEDLMFMLNNYGESGSVDVNSYMTSYNSRIDFNSIESFVFNSGRGNDSIELGYDNYSDDFIDAGAGDDFINAGLGNDTIDGGAGFDVLRLDFTSSQTGVYSFLTNGDSAEYSDGVNTISFNNIEAIDVFGSNYDDVFVSVNGEGTNDTSMYPINSIINGGEGFDQLVADYSKQTEDLMFVLNSYGDNSSLDVNSYMTGYNSRIDVNSIESFIINSGSGQDFIDLGFNNYSDDLIDAGAGDDWINAGFGNDLIEGGLGNDTYLYELGSGVDVISDEGGDKDTIILNGISPGDFSLSISNNDVIFNFLNFPSDRLIIQDYFNSADSIEKIDLGGQMFSIPPVTTTSNSLGQKQLALDYSDYSEDLSFNLNDYTGSPYLAIDSYMTGYTSSIGIDNIKSFIINSGSGQDFIDLGFNNYSDDLIDAGAGDDWINAGFGNDLIEGGLGNDTYLYELGSGVDVISDEGGDRDTIMLNGISLDDLSWDFNNNDLTFSFNNSPDDLLVISDYLNSANSIEQIDVAGQTFSIEEILKLTTAPQTIGEFGKIDNFDHNSQTIKLENSYENPVVFALPLSLNGGDPAVVRITDIQNDSFTAYLQEAEYMDGKHTKESFSYMVLEAGTWELDNGSLLEVGTINTDLVTTEGWENIAFDTDFADAPVVLSQVQTNFESDFVRTRQKPATLEGFSLSMEEEDALKASGHKNETVAWLAMDAGQGTWGDLEYQAGHTGREVTHRQYDLNFSQDFASEPSLFASLASYYGGDASGLRYRNLNEDRVQIMVEEDRSLDSERIHTSEIVDFLAISGDGDLTAIAYEPVDII